MKKLVALLTACVLAAFLCVALTGCGDEGTHEDAGVYNVYSVSSGGTSYDNDTISMFGLEDLVVVTLSEDGTCTIAIQDGDTKDFKWKDGEISGGGDTIEYTKDEEGHICLTLDDQELVLQPKK